MRCQCMNPHESIYHTTWHTVTTSFPVQQQHLEALLDEVVCRTSPKIPLMIRSRFLAGARGLNPVPTSPVPFVSPAPGSSDRPPGSAALRPLLLQHCLAHSVLPSGRTRKKYNRGKVRRPANLYQREGN